MQYPLSVKIRQSNFELLRLFAMFLIIWYHISAGFIAAHSEYVVLKSSWIVLHIGVVCFVLISGFFGIKPSISGFMRLLGVFFVYSIPDMAYGCYHAETFNDMYHSCMFITHTEYWFVRTYMALYLLSPLINKYNAISILGGKISMLLVLGIISVIVGNIAKYPLYADGKNVINFLFLYQIGHVLSCMKGKWLQTHGWKVLLIFVVFNVFLVSMHVYMYGTHIGRILWHLSFPYNSPFLIVNAILVFVLFGKLDFSSMIVNKMAGGVFAVYLIHESVSYGQKLYNCGMDIIYQQIENAYLLVIASSVFAILILFACLFINWLLTPLWTLLDIVSRKIENRIESWCNTIAYKE